MKFVNNKSLLSYEEMHRVAKVLVGAGIEKIRITGGEPFLRKNIMYFIESLTEINGLNKIAITTNATRSLEHIERLIDLGIKSYNVSIDSLDRARFFDITRRDAYEDVMHCITEMMSYDIELRLNCVVMSGKNTEDIIPFVELTKDNNISVRFIEEMPFNGRQEYSKIDWDYKRILNHITAKYQDIEKLQDPLYSTSSNYKVKDFAGSFGLIPAYTRNFCGSCNRIRITALGLFKTCLYDKGVFNIKDFIREGASDEELLAMIVNALSYKSINGIEAEKLRMQNTFESMSTIGG